MNTSSANSLRNRIGLAAATLAVLCFLPACGSGDNSQDAAGKDQVATRPALATEPLPATRPATKPATTTASRPATAPTTTAPGVVGQPVTLPDGLILEDIKIGDGPVVKAGQTITVHYTGALDDGSVFDSTLRSGKPASLNIGRGQVIRGWDEGIPGMRVGGRRKLTIPANLAYGADGRPGIPPNATLHFEVEVVKVQ